MTSHQFFSPTPEKNSADAHDAHQTLSFSVRQLHRDFLRAGADVCQALTFYANESTVEWGANKKSGIKKMPTVSILRVHSLCGRNKNKGTCSNRDVTLKVTRIRDVMGHLLPACLLYCMRTHQQCALVQHALTVILRLSSSAWMTTSCEK